jgi:pimeloyl-ACP methyl ester carboxylesterase
MASVRAVTVLALDDGRELAFTELGDPAGTPVFGFHGTPGSWRQLAVLEAAARAEGVRLIAPDRPGYGQSSYDPNRRLVDWPRDVAALADQLGLARFGVFGVSGGGPHAAVCARALGERLLGAAIVSGVAPPDTPGVLDGMMPVNRLNFRLARQSPLAVLPVMSLMIFVGRRFGERAMQSMQRSMPEADRRVFARPEVAKAFVADLRAASRTAALAAAQDFALFARPWRFRLEDIAVPVHIWQGDVDANVPVSHGKGLAARIPKATLHLCPGEGHMLFMDHAAEILRAAAGREGVVA